MKWSVCGLLIWEEIRLRYMGGEVPDNNTFNQFGDKGQIRDGGDMNCMYLDP